MRYRGTQQKVPTNEEGMRGKPVSKRERDCVHERERERERLTVESER